MAKDESGSSTESWKEQWASLSERGSLLTKDVGKLLSEQGKKISEASLDAASKAKDSLDEARQKRLLDKMAKDVDEILAETANTPIDEKEVERLRVLVATLEIRQKEQEALIEEMSSLADKGAIANPGNDEGRLGFVATIWQTYALIGFAVFWALLLVFVAGYIENNDLMILDQPAEPVFWIIGTMIWAYVVISQLSIVGSFEKLSLSFRIQATLGVGVATSATSLLPVIEEMPPMFHIFSWLVIVALHSRFYCSRPFSTASGPFEPGRPLDFLTSSGCQKKSSISSLNQSPLLMAGVRSLESLERPRRDRTYHPIERMGVETNRTRQNQTNTSPSAIGHAQTEAHPQGHEEEYPGGLARRLGAPVVPPRGQQVVSGAHALTSSP